MRHCPECGGELLEEDQAHCHGCGADLTLYESLTHAQASSKESGEDSEPDLEQADFEPVSAEDESAEADEATEGSLKKEVHSREPIVYHLDDLTGHEFEEALSTVFERLGYRTELPGKAADKGRDVIAERGDETLVIECKHQKGSVGRPVVQKLHSAASSYPGADRGLVITTSSFAGTAEEHASELRRDAQTPVELWDHDRLLKEARQADVYFTSGREGTEYIFRPELRPAEKALQGVKAKHLDGLKSSPRNRAEVIKVTHPKTLYTPAILVQFDVDKRFETQTYYLGRAQADGRGLFTLDSFEMTEDEEEHWTSAEYTVSCEDTVNGRPAISYFGNPLSQYQDEVARKVATQLTTTRSYQGKNNQTYTKRCEVKASEVSTDAKQVMLLHHTFAINIGPHSHEATVTANRDQPWLVSGTAGFRDGPQGFIEGNGLICNDCGLIAPVNGERAGEECQDCGRTLCASHHWTWPRKAPWPSQDLCSECYRSKDHDSHHLSTDETFLDDRWKAGLLGLLPGVAFLKGRRWLAALAHLPIWLLYVAALGFMADTGNVAGGAFWIAVFALISVSTSLYWSHRVREHRSNEEKLEGYEPEWQPDVR